MLRSTIRLGRVAGVELGLNWSWAIVFGLITWSLAAVVLPDSNPGLATGAYVVMAVVASILFFASLLLHELGHAIRAQHEGMKVEGITLWVFGGVARFSGMFPSAGAEFRIAIAGPLVTTAIAATLLTVSSLVPLPAGVDGVVAWLGRINLVLLIFNMLPAFPLDGGRVLRSALWALRGDFAWATHVAGRIGRGFGQVLIAFGIATALLLGAPGGLWIAFIGWFLVVAAGAETQLLTMRDALAGMRVADLMVRAPVVAGAADTLSAFVERLPPAQHYNAYPVLERDGRLVGLLPHREILAVRQGRWDEVCVRDVTVPLEKTLRVSEDKELGDAVAELLQTDLGRALVVRDGHLAGLLSITDVQRMLKLRPPAAAPGPPAA